jgi:hypothetical protein
MSVFRNAGHLFRLAALFVVVTAAFLLIRPGVVPHSFGEHGQYSGTAIGEILSNPIHCASH